MSERPPELVLWDFLRGALMTKALGAVVDAGVPQALANGPRPVSELAGDPDALHRLLRALASDGVFRETEPGVFEHTDVSRHLLAPGQSEFAHLFGGVLFEATMDLDAETTEAPFPRRFGAEYWDWLGKHPTERAAFDAAMAGGRERPAERLAALDWREGEVVVDAGGGNGALLGELIRRRPGLRGIVVDLPETVRDESAFGGRIEFVAGQLLRLGPGGRRVRPLGHPPRLARLRGGPDPADDPPLGTAPRAAADQRVGHQARQRAGRREVARSPDARSRGRPRARRGAVARAARGGGLRGRVARQPDRREAVLVRAHEQRRDGQQE